MIKSHSLFLACLALLGGVLHAAEPTLVLSHNFEDGMLPVGGKRIGKNDGRLEVVTQAQDPRAAGSAPLSASALLLAEDPDTQPGKGYRPALEIPLALPAGATVRVSFSFKQVSGDSSGLGFELLQNTPGYAVVFRAYLGRNLDRIMVAGLPSKANSSAIVAPGGLTNGPASTWHKLVIEIPVPPAVGDAVLHLDERAPVAVPCMNLDNPASAQAIRFFDDGAGPDFYYLDNLKVELVDKPVPVTKPAR